MAQPNGARVRQPGLTLSPQIGRTRFVSWLFSVRPVLTSAQVSRDLRVVQLPSAASEEVPASVASVFHPKMVLHPRMEHSSEDEVPLESGGTPEGEPFRPEAATHTRWVPRTRQGPVRARVGARKREPLTLRRASIRRWLRPETKIPRSEDFGTSQVSVETTTTG